MRERETPRAAPRRRVRTFWRQRGRPAWESVRWPAIAALFTGAIVLGWVGFDRYMVAAGQPSSLSDDLYLSLQLIVLQSGAVPPPIPWQLEVARFLVPAVAAYATVSAAAAVLGEQIGEMRARMSSDHAVVCGLGRLGASLARALAAAGYHVVAVEADPQNGAIGECREDGIIVLIGDGRDHTLLRKAGVKRARYLFAVTGDDGANSEVAIEAHGLVEGREGPPLTCFVHIIDGELNRMLKQWGLAQGGDGSFRLEYFNAAERGAPALLRDHEPFDDRGRTPLGQPHIVIVGLGEMGSNLVVHAARRWRSIRGDDGSRFKVTVVDDDADRHVAALCERYPRLEDVCEMRAHRMALDSVGFARADFLQDPNGDCDVTSVYVCVGHDAAGLSAALHLRRRLGTRDVPIVVRTTQSGGLGTLVRGGDDEVAYGDLSVFGLVDLVCRPDVLLEGQNEVLARAIHEDYVRRQREGGETPETNPSMVEWERLPDPLRESNRRQAADIGRKLTAVGCDVEPLIDWDAPPLAFAPDEVELLAVMEHDRWWEERAVGGWTLGAKDVERKTSPYLVPYGDLPEEIKDYDRDTVRAMPAFLAAVGFAVVRLGREASHG